MFKASERFINASVGMDPDVGDAKCESETNRLCTMMGKTDMNQDDATLLLEALAGEDSPFNKEQRIRISQVVQNVMNDEKDVATTHTTNAVKEQSCMKSYNYYPEELWAVLKSNDTLKNKFKHMAHFLVDVMQCRNPDQRSKRIIVATAHVASGLAPDPEDAYANLQTFNEIMKVKRDAVRGPQSLRIFPDDPAEYLVRYPSAYPEDQPPVKCKVKVRDILDRATKECTPLRSNNQKLKGTKRANSATGPMCTSPNPNSQEMVLLNQMSGLPMMQMMTRQMMQNFINNGAPENSDNPLITICGGGGRSGHARSRGAIDADTDSAESPPPAVCRREKPGRDSHASLPGCLQAFGKKSSSSNLASLQSEIQEKLDVVLSVARLQIQTTVTPRAKRKWIQSHSRKIQRNRLC